MTDSVIGALRVVLGADTAALDSGLESARGNLASFGSGVGIAMAAAAASVATAAYSIVSSIKSTITSADHLNSLSQSAGLTVEELSKLSYAANLSDISTESLASSLNKLTNSMSSVAQDGAGPAAQAFSALGISVKNSQGTLKSSSEVIGEVADKFASYRDGASKTALAIAIFGDAGAKLIPMLNQGKAGLQDAAEEAQNFGLVLDKKTTLAAAAFNENLKKADLVTQGLITTIAAKLLPTMELLSEQWLNFSKDVDMSMKAIDMVTNAITTVIKEVKIAYVELVAFGTQIGNLYTAIKGVLSAPFDPASAKIWQDYKAGAEQYGKEIDAVVAGIRTMGTATGALSSADWLVEGQALKSLNREVMAYGEAWKANAPTIAAGKNAVDRFIDSQNKSLETTRAEIATFGLLPGAMGAAKAQLQALAIAKANDTSISVAQQAQLDITKQKLIENGQALAALQLIQSNLTPLQLYQQELTKIQTLYDSGKLSIEQFALAAENAANRLGVGWQAMGQSLASFAGSMSQLAGTFAKNNKAMGIAAKAFGIAQAIINTQIAVTKALATYGPTPLGYAGVAAAIAQGAASVATIAAQGFKTGGSFKVGGSGGQDSQFVPIMATPGEQVDIWRPGEGPDRRGGGSGGTSVIELRGMSGQKFWTLDMVRDLVAGINDALPYGVQIKAA